MKNPSTIAMDKALETLHVAAEAIKKIDKIHDVEADNDADSGEVFFSVDGSSFTLRLVQIED